ncbi:MAG: NUDIX domain-containing protein [Desulfobacterales bacterium]|nr:NUDIX domain-containing protein [Desulfobacterales bacterium]
MTQKHKYVVIAADTIIFTIKEDALNVLLIEMKKEPRAGRWAVPGGLVKPEESVDAAAKRHLEACTGISHVYLEQLYTFGRVDRDPFGRVVSVAYFALIPWEDVRLNSSRSRTDIQWREVSRLPELAYDHGEMIRRAVERLKAKIEYTNIAYSLLPPRFTLTELQKIYEIILGRTLDKRNFRKKIVSLKIVEKTGDAVSGKAHRPAALYKFTTRDIQMVRVI